MILTNGNNIIRVGNSILDNTISNFKNNCLWCFEMDQTQTNYLVDSTGNYNNYFTLYSAGASFVNSLRDFDVLRLYNNGNGLAYSNW